MNLCMVLLVDPSTHCRKVSNVPKTILRMKNCKLLNFLQLRFNVFIGSKNKF